jgi:hypothetical protein
MLRTFLAWFLLLLATNSVKAQEVVIDPTQNPSSLYRLFKTSNIYTFLKLDTSTGKIWQVQWSMGENRFTVPLNTNVLVAGGKAGRFTLYPTTNIYNFILLDQESGDTWQVQWGIKEESRVIIPIE